MRISSLPKALGRLANRTDGVSIAEFAIIAPVFFLMLLGILEGGRLFSSWLIITNEVREGARYGVVGIGDPARESTLAADIRTYVEGRARGLLGADPTQLVIDVQVDTALPQVSVAAQYRFDTATPLFRDLLPNPLILRARSVMKAEL